ncbi:DUF4157 domain-containing protein [Streptomyces sp. NPDC014733]|uniref:eCIS core domain-containing protein n=1 Tax=Streptomyces sp. NPDC014733 TaxID=3364885 RepID=UPI0036FCB253
MRARDAADRPAPVTPPAHAVRPPASRLPAVPERPADASPHALAALQRTAGNAAVVQMLRADGHAWAQQEHRHGPGCGHAAVQRSAVHDVLRTPGRPLDEETRSDMEARLGADFSDVRVHTDPAARTSAAEVGARAFTSGNHIVIGDGGGDRHTLAHELTHVIQQRRGPVAGTDNGRGLSVSDPGDRFERAAEENAHRVLSGPAPAPAEGRTAASGPVRRAVAAVQRKTAANGGRLVKAGRHDFSTALQNAMPVGPGQARCHTVSYETITAGVMEAVNKCLNGEDAVGYLYGMVDAVYPQGGNLLPHQRTLPTATQMAAVCRSEFKAAETALEALKKLFPKKGSGSAAQAARADELANDLIEALNNSPANLRLGDGSTNSSIQSGLDLAPARTGAVKTLGPDALVVDQSQPMDATAPRTTKLGKSLQVLLVEPDHEQQVWTLLTRTTSKAGQLHLFSSGPLLQSSDRKGMKTSTMNNKNPTPTAIRVPGSTPEAYFVFTV